jgi:cyclic-di-GMP phosphodiesterase TipF (flagellum assembly factor)
MMVAMVALTGLGLYNTMSARVRDRTDIAAQIADLSRGTADMGRQMAELGRRLAAAEVKVGTAVDMAVAAAKPVAAEIEELGALIKQLAETVALHDIALGSNPLAPTSPGTASDEVANRPGKSGSRLASETASGPGPGQPPSRLLRPLRLLHPIPSLRRSPRLVPSGRRHRQPPAPPFWNLPDTA